jgi:CDK inhibitor PHO81
VLLQIELGDYQGATTPNSFHFVGTKAYGSYKLRINVKPERDMTYFVNIPMKDKITIFSSTLEKLNQQSIEFDLYPSFGTKTVGRALFSQSQFKQFVDKEDAVNGKEFFVPLFDNQLQFMGEISFRLSIIKPFVHPAMSIGGTIETYWKSTTVVQTNTGENAHSLVTGSSLAEEFVELVCQTTKDHVVVVYSDWCVNVGSIPIPIHSLNYDQLVQIFGKKDLNCDLPSKELASSLSKEFFTLNDALKVNVANVVDTHQCWSCYHSQIPYH